MNIGCAEFYFFVIVSMCFFICELSGFEVFLDVFEYF